MTSSGDFLARGSKEKLDDKKEAKLVGLGLIEEFNEEKHVAKANAQTKLEAENQNLKDKTAGLEKDLEAEKAKTAGLEKELEAEKAKTAGLEKELEAEKAKTAKK